MIDHSEKQPNRRQVLQILGVGALATSCTHRVTSSSDVNQEHRFLHAVRSGDVGRVRAMLESQRHLATARDADGKSALVHAFVEGQREIGAILRTHIDSLGSSLDIVEATLVEDWARVEELAAAEPELCLQAHAIGGTPLYAGALTNSGSLYRLRSLGCRSDHAPGAGDGRTPARAAMDCRSLTGARSAATDILSNGGSARARQRGGDSVLHGAVRRKSDMLVRLAIRKGADVDARDDDGRTPRDLAAQLAWRDGVELLERHATLPCDNRSSRFAFDASRAPIVRPNLSDVPQARQSAITGASHVQFARLRELVGTDKRLTFSISTDAELAIEACAHIGRHDIIRFHLDCGAPLSLPTATSLGDLDFVHWLLDQDPLLIHERGAHDFPVLWYAAIGGGSVEVAEALVDRGADVDQESDGVTTLHWCVLRNDPDLATWLLDKGANIDAVGYKWGRDGATPLALARERKKDSMVALLEQRGARPRPS